MKLRLLILLLSVFGVLGSAWAATETQYIYRNGYASGYCSGSSGYLCIDQVRQSAKRDAERGADADCRIRQGVLDTWGNSCSEMCNPSNLPYDAPFQNISCSSNCSFACKISR